MFSKYEGIADITLLSRNMLGKSMNSIPLLMNGILMKCWGLGRAAVCDCGTTWTLLLPLFVNV